MSKDDSLDFLLSKIKQNRKEGKSGVKDTPSALGEDHSNPFNQEDLSKQRLIIPTPTQPTNASHPELEAKPEQLTASPGLILAPPPHPVLPLENENNNIQVEPSSGQDGKTNVTQPFSLEEQHPNNPDNNTNVFL